MSNTRNFVLRDEEGNEHGVFTGKQPRQAALKAANRGAGTKSKPDIIRLRERGTKKVHVFKAWKELVAAPKKTGLTGCLRKSASPLLRKKRSKNSSKPLFSYTLENGVLSFYFRDPDTN